MMVTEIEFADRFAGRFSTNINFCNTCNAAKYWNSVIWEAVQDFDNEIRSIIPDYFKYIEIYIFYFRNITFFDYIIDWNTVTTNQAYYIKFIEITLKTSKELLAKGYYDYAAN